MIKLFNPNRKCIVFRILICWTDSYFSAQKGIEDVLEGSTTFILFNIFFMGMIF